MGALGIDVKTQIWSVFTDMGVNNHDWETQSSLALQPCTMHVEIVRTALGRQPSCALRP